MRLLSASGVEKSYGDRHILQGCDLHVNLGDRVGLVGPNGSGKSTLLKVLVGEERQDHGAVERAGLLGYLSQEPILPGETVGEAMDEAIAWHAALLADYEQAMSAGDERAAARCADRIELAGWTVDHKVNAMMDQLQCPPRAAALSRLSGGERRRLALARSLLASPELLVLDEPTNHLDADTIEWLQAWLLGFRGALLLVTHDRYLLEAVANRVVEVEEGKTVAYEGSYTDYLLERAERQAALSKERDRHANLLAREAEWASRSPAARSVKQKARLKRLDDLKAVPLAKTELEVKLDLRSGVHRGGALLELHHIHHGFGERQLLKDLHLVVQPGDRLGVIGPNGVGKSTLLQVVAGTLKPHRGERAVAPRVQVAVLDQARSGLPLDETVWEAAGGGNDQVIVHGRPVHVASFLERFAFTRTSHEQRVSTLSGGERARLLMARLMLKGANLLLLDEPTNDLDLHTLRILEEALLDFDGAAVVITHDRAFLDRVCTAVLAFEPAEDPLAPAEVVQYATRTQHLEALARKEAARAAQAAAKAGKASPAAKTAPAAKAAPAGISLPPSRKGLSFKEKTELDALPAQIEAAEEAQAALAARMSDPATWQRPAAELAALHAEVEKVSARVEALYTRWTALEERS
ncbi:MAG: hypothetical protein RL071_532 [Pseudomonadota bacterium]|jgi:ATP-binding cassette subfamily F protein uup